MKKLIPFLLLFLTTTLSFANDDYAAGSIPVRMVDATTVIQDLDQAISAVKGLSPLQVVFPSQVPAPETTLYASYSSYSMNSNYKNFWQISADATPDCKGMRVCNIGVITAERGRKMESMFQDLPDLTKHSKQLVKLANGISAYYTPAHTEASRVNATIEWESKGILYTLRWKISSDDAAKQVMIDMANSVL